MVKHNWNALRNLRSVVTLFYRVVDWMSHHDLLCALSVARRCCIILWINLVLRQICRYNRVIIFKWKPAIVWDNVADSTSLIILVTKKDGRWGN